jgi:hypothetical protein
MKAGAELPSKMNYAEAAFFTAAGCKLLSAFTLAFRFTPFFFPS